MKTIYFKTNYNNKLATQAFLHIDVAPKDPIPESVIQNTQVEIRTADNSHPPVKAKLMDLLRLNLCDLAYIHTLPSHGLDTVPFIEKLMKENPELKPTSPMAVYYYVRQE